jgi:hypothetical protein
LQSTGSAAAAAAAATQLTRLQHILHIVCHYSIDPAVCPAVKMRYMTAVLVQDDQQQHSSWLNLEAGWHSVSGQAAVSSLVCAMLAAAVITRTGHLPLLLLAVAA